MIKNITNDSYLIIVYSDFDDILVSDFKSKDSEDITNTINDASSQVKTSTGQKLLKLVSAGVTSSIAQSMASKISLPNSVRGRIQSSLYDIVADGKISKLEVAEDFIGSCTNELDSTAIAMGFPTSQALYEAIGPDGAGVISKDFLAKFQKEADKVAGEKLAQRNKVAQDISVLKFKLITGDSESWSFGLPSRKTEKGFNIVDAIERENITRDFQISIIQGDYSGITDMYVAKSIVEFIADRKIPFDIYVNDANNNYTEILRHCFFSGISWETEGVNCLNASVNITKIPEYEVKTETVDGKNNKVTRRQSGSKKTKQVYNKSKTVKKKAGTKANVGTPDAQATLKSIKSRIANEKNGGGNVYRHYTKVDKSGKVIIDYSRVNPDLASVGLKGDAKNDYGVR